MSCKRYPEEFKIAAVKQVTDSGYSAPDVAQLPRVRESEQQISHTTTYSDLQGNPYEARGRAQLGSG